MEQNNEIPAQRAHTPARAAKELKIYPMLPSEYIRRHGVELFLMGHRLPKEIRGLPVFRDFMPELPPPRSGQIINGTDASSYRGDSSTGQQATLTIRPQPGSMQALKKSLMALEELKARLSTCYGQAKAVPTRSTLQWEPVAIQTSLSMQNSLNQEADKRPQLECLEDSLNPSENKEQQENLPVDSQGQGTGENQLGSKDGAEQEVVIQEKKNVDDEEEKHEQKLCDKDSVPSHDGSDSAQENEDDQTPDQSDIQADSASDSEEAPSIASSQHTAQAQADAQNDDDVFQGLRKSMVVNVKTGRLVQCLTCVACQRTFSKLCNATDHVRTHTNTQPYSCDHCSKTFTQQGNRDRHMIKSVCARRRRQ